MTRAVTISYSLCFFAALAALIFVTAHRAMADLNVGDTAPSFSLKTQDGINFNLEQRKGQGWTVLYFYPKAETPGCTKEACAFSDSIDKVRSLGAEVYGISADTVREQRAFHNNHHLKFDLLADPNGDVITLYGAKMPLVTMAKRWTFILDPELVIRSVDRDVDPVKDADRVAAELQELKTKK